VGKKNNNCQAYALDYYQDSGGHKLQPGDFARDAGLLKTDSLDLTSCNDVIKKMLLDAKANGDELIPVDPDAPCPIGSQKIMLVIAPDRDFHFYRYHRDLVYRVKTSRTVANLAAEFGVTPDDVSVAGLVDPTPAAAVPRDAKAYIRKARVWSHKQGFSPEGPILTDACGKLIKDPRTACRNYGGDLNYSTTCPVLCFIKRKTNV
jgi:hypothetical protein